MNRSVLEAADRLKAFVREYAPGGCKMFSKGDDCTCPLCDVDFLAGDAPTFDEPLIEKNYRSRKLKRWANDAPHCMSCMRQRDGTIVGAHSNQLTDGKGKGIKAHDFRIAYICSDCHYLVDQSKMIPREEKHRIWEEAHRRTIGWLFLTGRLTVS